MMADRQSAIAELVIVPFMDVASATLLAYDVMIKLDVEVEHIWMRKWSFLTVVYIIQRYLPFLDGGSVLYYHFGNLTDHYCTLIFNLNAWSYVVGISLSQFILTLRVWAVWNRSISVGIGFVIFFLACWIPSYVLLAQFSRLTFGPFPITYYPDFGCFFASALPLLPFWVCWLAYDTGTFVMILIPGLKAYHKGSRSGLLKTISQDGVAYYVIMFLFILINVICTVVLPVEFRTTLMFSFARITHSLGTSRIILHIRQAAWRRAYTHETSLSQIPFTQNGHEESSSAANSLIHDHFDVSELSTQL
ncbi:hypothetical protein E1B28_010805 [Marasmius oreades]|uniref:DUF6533 domain-containing protein n=1 Tax=Marasmius oreades TaxID=181124 RepID=A0A9P7RSQ5_9AGAR|nr:uncharacterized protein E1B28_010805 [Marasmius oreades]KAG7089096.1 hypothetical protein E1B28_010805 [Marasmius oreades]